MAHRQDHAGDGRTDGGGDQRGLQGVVRNVARADAGVFAHVALGGRDRSETAPGPRLAAPARRTQSFMLVLARSSVGGELAGAVQGMQVFMGFLFVEWVGVAGR